VYKVKLTSFSLSVHVKVSLPHRTGYRKS